MCVRRSAPSVRSHRILATARPTVPKPTKATRREAAESREPEFASCRFGELLGNVSLRKNQASFLSHILLAPARSESGSGRSGGLPDTVSIKVGKMMRSRRSGVPVPSCDESQAEPLGKRRLSMPSAAVRHHAPVMGGEWMIGKFATASALLVLCMMLGKQGFAQTVPAGQTPAAPASGQQPPAAQPPAQPPASGQEPADEDSTLRRKKIHDYKTWNYNVGFGANVDSGTTKQFVRGRGIGVTGGG